jgi:hypothetical protein
MHDGSALLAELKSPDLKAVSLKLMLFGARSLPSICARHSIDWSIFWKSAALSDYSVLCRPLSPTEPTHSILVCNHSPLSVVRDERPSSSRNPFATLHSCILREAAGPPSIDSGHALLAAPAAGCCSRCWLLPLLAAPAAGCSRCWLLPLLAAAPGGTLPPRSSAAQSARWGLPARAECAAAPSPSESAASRSASEAVAAGGDGERRRRRHGRVRAGLGSADDAPAEVLPGPRSRRAALRAWLGGHGPGRAGPEPSRVRTGTRRTARASGGPRRGRAGSAGPSLQQPPPSPDWTRAAGLHPRWTPCPVPNGSSPPWPDPRRRLSVPRRRHAGCLRAPAPCVLITCRLNAEGRATEARPGRMP